MLLRSHESVLLSLSEVTQIGESSSFFLPDNFTGTTQQIERVLAILLDKLLILVPIDLNRPENIEK